MYNDLTKKQLNVLKEIIKFIDNNNIAPTIVELKSLFNFSSNQSVLNYLNTLEQKGYIKRERRARGIKVLENAEELIDDNEFWQILKEISEKRKTEEKSTAGIIIENPYYVSEASGKFISGVIDNEEF